MENSTIQIFARIRPVKKGVSYVPSKHWIEKSPVADDESSTPMPRIGFYLPRDEQQGLINNSRENFEFPFNKVFDAETKQEEVFDFVAKPVIDSALNGYNGTVFAYGQTGSGKTFTITGGAERYSDRGLIPRTIQYIFKHVQKMSDCEFNIQISYLELYNENGYDLLDNSRDAKKLEDLSKITIQEDEGGHTRVNNLSLIPVVTEEEALNLLFVGDTNRMIAETPSNPSSSRSHCIFIINLKSRRQGDDRIRKSKLHLVDLAGSERVSKTGINGKILSEAKYINLSLHYLEQVIIALYEKGQGKRVHIPYRNSLMTTVLKDSLGGNCRTTMIATLAVEDPFLDESISTCRFAQRVALIENSAVLNEEIDPQMLIDKLKREVARLRSELAISRGEGDSNEPLPPYEVERVRQAVEEYLTTEGAELLFADFRKVTEAFSYLKSKVTGPTLAGSNAVLTDDEQNFAKSQEKLKQLLTHRDNEISVLVNLLNQYQKSSGDVKLPAPASFNKFSHVTPFPDLSKTDLPKAASSAIVASAASTLGRANNLDEEKLAAFEEFRKQYPKTQWIEEQKALIKSKYAEAKAFGEKANQARTLIKELKVRLSVQVTDYDDNRAQDGHSALKEEVALAAADYKRYYQRLKELKVEIEHLQIILDRARQQMTDEFYGSSFCSGSTLVE